MVDCEPTESAQARTPPGRPGRWRRALLVLLLLVAAYVATTYVVLPWAWRRYVRRHPALDGVPGITETAARIPGDPVNVGLIGTEDEVKAILLAAAWYPADPLTLRSCLGIAAATMLKRPYDDAPVSNLYLFGRKEDLAFEQPVGSDPKQRHHVRFWRSDKVDEDGRPVWLGSATYDHGVGFSHTTGQITHHIAADIDAERDYLFRCLEQAGGLTEVFTVDGFHVTREGRNGGGDRWYTDGSLLVGVIAAN